LTKTKTTSHTPPQLNGFY